MASTRHVEIFQDPGSPANLAYMAPRLSYDFMGNEGTDENSQPSHFSRGPIIFDPPTSCTDGRSPLKPLHQPSSSPPSTLLDTSIVSLPPPPMSTFTTDSPVKQSCAAPYDPLVRQEMSAKPIFTTFPSTAPISDENSQPRFHNDNTADFPNPSYGAKAPLKRSLSNANTQSERPSKKGCREDSDGPDALHAEAIPLVLDDGRKPPYSYAALIGTSILRAPGKRLTLAQIYKWISDTFSYYRIKDTGWQNSIRHNLSLNKAFIKQERPKDDPGKGNYWAIEPGMESQFLKDKPTRRPTSSSGPSTKSSSFLSSEANVWSSQPPALLPPKSAPKATKRSPKILELSSDATIPASDDPPPDDEVRESASMPPPAVRLPLSSPLQHIRSSPPLGQSTSFRDDTPSPEGTSGLPSSNLRSRKRNFTAMDDSGYFSSLDSSASRPFADPKLPDLNSGRPRIKRGRAEEEIARIRSSSHDISPSKGRSVLKQPKSSIVSSSPLRHFDGNLMLPPLTPALKLKPPPKPPASISPNTNLRNHRNKIRELVGSPIRDTSLFSDDVSFSPAFNIVQDEINIFEDDFPTFPIFTDDSQTNPRPSSTSPVKRSSHRPRTDSTSKTSSILADVTGASLNSRISSSKSKTPNLDSPLQRKLHKSPVNFGNRFDDLAKEDMFGLDLLEDEEPDDFGGLDILQGFQKIGRNQNPGPPMKKFSRPILGARNHTTRF